jgi:hypothetical protein
MSLQDIEPSEHWTLVVRGASTVKPTRALGVWSQLEGWVQPSILLEGWLYIVMSVDQERFLSP